MFLKLKLAVIRTELHAKANFDRNQPRLPRGGPGGGRWTDDDGTTPAARRMPASEPVRLAQARTGRNTTTVVVGTRRLPATVREAVAHDLATMQANAAIARVRTIDPRWQPAPGLSQTIEGAIAQQRAIVREANAYLRRIRRPGFGDNGGPPLDAPAARTTLDNTLGRGGQAIGEHMRGASYNIRTVSPDVMNDLVLRLTGIGTEISTPETYPGVWYDVGNACVVGFRLSDPHGMTIDVIESGSNGFLTRFKFHKGSGR